MAMTSRQPHITVLVMWPPVFTLNSSRRWSELFVTGREDVPPRRKSQGLPRSGCAMLSCFSSTRGRSISLLPESRPAFASRTRLVSLHRRSSYSRDEIPGDRAKDILYMHDTLEVFGSGLEDLKELGEEAHSRNFTPTKPECCRRHPKSSSANSPTTVRRPSQIAGQRVSPGAIQQACQYGFQKISEWVFW